MSNALRALYESLPDEVEMHIMPQDIAEGVKNDSLRCPGALAALRAFKALLPDVEDLSIMIGAVAHLFSDYGLIGTYLFGAGMHSFIEKFDDGKEVAPTMITLWKDEA